MSEKTRQKKDGQDKNKDNQRMRAADNDTDEKTAGKKTSQEGKTKRLHKIDSLRSGFGDDET
jgi:hypothetical protein